MFLWQPLVALTRLTELRLGSTDVYGDATVLRTSTRLGSDWPSTSSRANLCAAFSGGCPAGSSPIAHAATFVGNDACACCTDSADLSRDAAGVCVDSTVG